MLQESLDLGGTYLTGFSAVLLSPRLSQDGACQEPEILVRDFFEADAQAVRGYLSINMKDLQSHYLGCGKHGAAVIWHIDGQL